jgi:hypothetical protein
MPTLTKPKGTMVIKLGTWKGTMVIKFYVDHISLFMIHYWLDYVFLFSITTAQVKLVFND